MNSIVTTGIKGPHLNKIDKYKLAITSFILNTVKTGLYFELGTELPQIPMTTQNLAEFLRFSGEINKGIKAQVPVEFIIPTGLESGINFAHIYNTEVSKKESMTGLLVEHWVSKNLGKKLRNSKEERERFYEQFIDENL